MRPRRQAEALRLRLFDFDIFRLGTAMLDSCVRFFRRRHSSARPSKVSDPTVRYLLIEGQRIENCPSFIANGERIGWAFGRQLGRKPVGVRSGAVLSANRRKG